MGRLGACKKGERRIEGVLVHRQPALGGDVKATVVIRLDKLGKLLHRANNSTGGRAKAAGGAIEVVLESPHPMAGDGPIAGMGYSYPA